MSCRPLRPFRETISNQQSPYKTKTRNNFYVGTGVVENDIACYTVVVGTDRLELEGMFLCIDTDGKISEGTELEGGRPTGLGTGLAAAACFGHSHKSKTKGT